VQDIQIWSSPSGVLGGILEETKLRVEALLRRRGELFERAAGRAAPTRARSLAAAISRRQNVAVVAEIKRMSPSKGAINERIEAAPQARALVAGGAAAISVLTESSHFGGSMGDLHAVSQAVTVPILRKDFIIDEVQLLEALAYGASAVLLIARAIAPERRRDMAARAHELGLEVLLEVRDRRELESALDVPHAIIGVNNRNLETLEIDKAVGESLIPQVPVDRLAVYESGVASRADVERAAATGADAILAGSMLSASTDPAACVRELANVPWKGRVAAS
jgi:indole-3-glycerol phosphate synthase